MNVKRTSPHDVEIGSRIRARRLACGISQTELGRRLGITFQQVQKYEKGTNRVSAARLQKVAEVLDVPVSFFFAAGDEPSDPIEAMRFLDTAHAVRLMRAYSRIADARIQRALVAVAESLAGTADEEGAEAAK